MSTKSAILFPGQGSQAVGMLGSLARENTLVGATFEEASESLSLDLWKLACEGPEEELNRTELTQPAMLTADIATWRVWKDMGGPDPDFSAGHSLGEYAALVAAGSIDFTHAVSLVRLRGQLMQDATPPGTGAMAAILGLDDDVLTGICEDVSDSELVSCANFNSPGQVVIAGHSGAVDRASQVALEKGAKRAIPLPVSVPSHCALMKPAADRLSEALGAVEFRQPRFPVLHNVDASIRSAVNDIREALVAQLWKPVQWTATVRNLAESGVSLFAECGPGKVLAGLNRRIDRALDCSPLIDSESIAATTQSWSNT